MPVVFSGLVVPLDLGGSRRHVLAYGPDAAALGIPLFGAPIYLRPGYRLVDGGEFLLPAKAIDDVGQHFDGPDAYDWIERRGDLFPRADVIGTLLSGARREVFMKELDLADLAVFAGPSPESRAPVRLDLVLEARAVPDGYALAPVPCPAQLGVFSRVLPCYRLAPGAFGAAGAALLSQLLLEGRRDWHVTFDDLDDAYDR